MVVRPVDVSPPQSAFPVVDPTTGRATETFQRFLLNLWERTGGFTDEFFQILSVSNLGTIQGLIATSQAEALAQVLGDVASQGRLNSIDRLSQEVAALGQQVNLLQGVVASNFRVPLPTRVVTFTQSDTWKLNPDIKAIVAFAVGGGGGGAGGTPGIRGGGGGGGANYSFAFIEGSLLPETVAVTVGAAGAAGASSGDGGAGGDSTFGSFCAARGGYGGTAAAGTGGAVNEDYGGLFRGGAGGDGGSGGDAVSAPNNNPGAPGGGGGGLYVAMPVLGGAGGAGNGRSLLSEGGGGTAGSSAGGAGGETPVSATFIGPGFGGGGGGSTSGASGSGGAGYNGAGGGGGAARPGSARPGGIGGEGRVWVLELY